MILFIKHIVSLNAFFTFVFIRLRYQIERRLSSSFYYFMEHGYNILLLAFTDKKLQLQLFTTTGYKSPFRYKNMLILNSLRLGAVFSLLPEANRNRVC
jgi:hypothetical protein